MISDPGLVLFFEYMCVECEIIVFVCTYTFSESHIYHIPK
jgi:hypothetical protein